ncbi:formate-dependent nitrite reductase complex subunit NrfG [Nicoletella semolina]|uniref:Formate-dependent nitrite reductase complex subunit NrfG n=1 Tax=Nicoletella semolina TaxID=271160 RepID=A0A4R2N8R1_9PAST|nr:cytochrome C biogenesis protein [Nicoletella semolina]MDH2924523.1 cytochrome C biogenesis protein [Nicoletella semolina]TCP17349.1 formate-dependent nitrite reductase complex subunit NrfG [Nicoletella semolina]
MKSERSVLNAKHYQQAVNSSHYFAQKQEQQEWLNEVHQRREFELRTLQLMQNIPSKRPLFRFVGLVLLLIFTLSSIYYWQTGRYQIVQNGQQAFVEFQQQKSQESSIQRNEHYIVNLQNQLRDSPNNGELWFELGQAYALNNDFEFAHIALNNARVILDNRPAVLGVIATNDYYWHKQRLTDQAKQWITQALATDPQESASLLLLASDAFLHNDYQQAITYWEKVLDSDNPAINRSEIIRSIEMAKQLHNAKKR